MDLSNEKAWPKCKTGGNYMYILNKENTFNFIGLWPMPNPIKPINVYWPNTAVIKHHVNYFIDHLFTCISVMNIISYMHEHLFPWTTFGYRLDMERILN